MHRLIAACALAVPTAAHAHDAGASAATEPWVSALLLVSAALYVAGLRNLWKRAGVGRGVTYGQAAMFAAGWLSMVAALGGPVEAWSGASFAAHMVQHEVMMLVAAPLLAASRPLGVFAWGLPAAARRRLRTLTRAWWLRAFWSWLTSPMWATVLSIAALWLWHAPRLFDAAVEHRGWHAAQHATFFVTALAFWWAMRAGASSRHAVGVTVGCLFVAMVVTGALGGLLAFSGTSWYAAYADTVSPFAWTSLEDQQMGGLVMWIPGGTVYMAMALLRLREALDDRRPRMAMRHART